MRYLFLLPALLLLSPLWGQRGGVQWLEDLSLDAVQVRAAAADRPVVLLFTSNVVMPCTYLEETVLTDSLVMYLLRENFICLRLPASSAAGEKLVRRFGVEELPSLLFLDARGRLVNRRAGVLPVAELVLLLEEVNRPANHLVPLARDAAAARGAGAPRPQLPRDEIAVPPPSPPIELPLDHPGAAPRPVLPGGGDNF